MTEIGRIVSVWRYPVKSMRGESLGQARLCKTGLEGDRLYALKSATADSAFPYHTGRQQAEMVLYRPRLAPADHRTDRPSPPVEITTPEGDVFQVEDPALIEDLKQRSGKPELVLSLHHSDRAIADSRPISLFSMQTVAQLERDIGDRVDLRRFRANLYAEFPGYRAFGEEELVGKTLRLGEEAEIAILERDRRCKMISLDPDTAAQNPEILRHLTRTRSGCAGLYAAVLVEGCVKPGDPIALLD